MSIPYSAVKASPRRIYDIRQRTRFTAYLSLRAKAKSLRYFHLPERNVPTAVLPVTPDNRSAQAKTPRMRRYVYQANYLDGPVVDGA